jgi:hypothetical protein
MNNTIQAAPYANLLGIQDTSAVAPVLNPETLPTHLPQVYLFAPWGPTLPQLVDSSSAESMYGVEAFDLLGEYATHQTVLANVITANGGSMMVQRVLPSDAAPPATLGLYLDIVAEPKVQQYQRNSDGTYSLDQNGNPIPVTGVGATAAGVIAKWVVHPLTNGEIGQGQQMAGSFQNSSGTQSQLYPILEYQAAFAGDQGNDLGVSIWAPTSDSNPAANLAAIQTSNSYVYNLSFMQRANSISTPYAIQTQGGQQSVQFTFAPGVVDPNTDGQLSYGVSVIPAYQSVDTPGAVPVYSPFQQMYVYQQNLLTVLNMIFAAEQPAGLLGAASPVNPYLVNIFGATNPEGVPYYNFLLQGVSAGGLLFAQGVTQFATGGFDGTMSNATFDTAVAAQLTGWGSLEAPLLDDAMYPQSVIYDSGFTLPTKKLFAIPMSLRKDIAVVVSTQDVSLPQNSSSDESSIAVALRTTFNNYPESQVYGTPVCRAVIMAQSGFLLNSLWANPLPLTLQLCARAITYMGAGNGVWRSGYAWDQSPNNQITMFRGVNNAYKPANARNADWQTGLVWAQNFDRKSLFWPAVQTVYTDDSSVLNSAITMFACVEVEKVCQRAWRQLTGEANLTNDQFVVKSNNLINSMLVNRFDGRFIFQVNTYFTQQDIANGNTWSCAVTVGSGTQKTIGTFTVVAARSDSLTTSTTGSSS